MKSIVVISGASNGFGALAARALTMAGVFSKMKEVRLHFLRLLQFRARNRIIRYH
jgi:NADP-dependent 3-hydroxy acid dehydrogenase YdfG